MPGVRRGEDDRLAGGTRLIADRPAGPLRRLGAAAIQPHDLIPRPFRVEERDDVSVPMRDQHRAWHFSPLQTGYAEDGDRGEGREPFGTDRQQDVGKEPPGRKPGGIDTPLIDFVSGAQIFEQDLDESHVIVVDISGKELPDGA